MLLIAQPKSASTSLLKTLAMILKIKYKNGISKGKNDFLCNGFEELQKYHTTTHKRSFGFLKALIESRIIIYKDHILPTKEHIEYIKKINFPVVILLRTPEETMDNYKRLLQDYKKNKLNENDIKELKLIILDKIDFNKLKNDIENFKKGWEKANIKNALYINFIELVMCPFHTCKKIVEHYGYKMPRFKKFELIKAKGNHGYNTFTGVGYERAKKEWHAIYR